MCTSRKACARGPSAATFPSTCHGLLWIAVLHRTWTALQHKPKGSASEYWSCENGRPSAHSNVSGNVTGNFANAMSGVKSYSGFKCKDSHTSLREQA